MIRWTGRGIESVRESPDRLLTDALHALRLNRDLFSVERSNTAPTRCSSGADSTPRSLLRRPRLAPRPWGPGTPGSSARSPWPEKPRYADLLLELTEPEPLPEAIHSDLIDLLRTYYLIGGMPEVVGSYAETGDARLARQIQSEILDSYLLDFARHAPATDLPKLGLIWDSIPRDLAKENKKFMFSAVKQGARAREYENALRWIQDAGLVHLCLAASASRSPLEHYAERNVFKVYALDVGLLGAMTRTPPRVSVEGDRLFTEYRGALAENYVAQELVAGGQPTLYYWRSTGGRAELDFLYETDRAVVPIEGVKAGLSPKSKSLRSYDQQFAPEVLVRASLLNLKRDGKICNVPLYAVSAVRRFV